MEQIARAFAARTERSAARANNIIRTGGHESLQELLNLYASADVILSSRLHGCILALATGRRLVALSGDRKVEAFMAAAGLDQWVVGLDEVERLPVLLDRIAQQIFPQEFVARSRYANRAIADSIRSLPSASTDPTTYAASSTNHQKVTG